MFQYITTHDHIEGRSGKGQLLTGAGDISDLQARQAGVNSRSLQRRLRWIDPRHMASQPGQLLRKQTAATACIQQAHALRITYCLLSEYFLQIPKTRRIEPGAQKAQRRILIPPGMAEPVVEFVINRHTPDTP